MPIYDFKCDECGRVDEHLVKLSVKNMECPECGANMSRQIGIPNFSTSSLATGESATPDSIDRWEKMRKQKMAIEKKNQENHGTYD